jgi:cytochrome o ubiquinol oxidase subunit 1
MYIIVAMVMLLRGFADAAMMRAQLAMATGGQLGIFPPEHYDQIFTAHGVIMIIFMAMPFMTGLMNIVVPLQIGARDVAFPFLNSLSFWLLVAACGWSTCRWAWATSPAPAGWPIRRCPSWASARRGGGLLHLGATDLRHRDHADGGQLPGDRVEDARPGMKLMQMPIFTWTCTWANVLIVASFPILTGALAMLSLDRYLGFHFFTAEAGGNAMMYLNLFWAWGHPEVYILVLPAFGIFSEVISTFTGKRLFGHTR